ncbi:MAG: hypothetical protein LBM98_10295 [Oscillospiraceae bacterium]|jgi:hypothetical protein|nr:hypothetical protein [Oscillospiraceae bacterium]
MFNVQYADGSERTIDRAVDADAAAVARIYRDIQINADNYRVRLDPDSRENFANVGGMFYVHDEASFTKELNNPRSFFLSRVTARER